MSEGGGHGASWIVTYSDMITLLMTLFIVIVTFGSKDQGKHAKKLDSVVGGKGGTGAAGAPGQGTGKDSVTLRISPLSRTVYNGSQTPPSYSDPYPEPSKAAIKALDVPPLGKLSDNYVFRLPAKFLFDDKGKLTTSGTTFLTGVATSVRSLPFDVQLEVSNKERIPAAARASQYLFEKGGLHPSRVGLALGAPGPGAAEDEIRVELLRNR